MKITICASISSTPKIKEVVDKLETMGIETNIPYTSKRIIGGEVAFENYLKEVEKNGDKKFRDNTDVIKEHYEFIKNSDAILVLNIDKKGIKNYIGGNVLMEIGFAYVNNKKIFLLNPIPGDVSYVDEIKAMVDVVLNGDLTKIKA